MGSAIQLCFIAFILSLAQVIPGAVPYPLYLCQCQTNFFPHETFFRTIFQKQKRKKGRKEGKASWNKMLQPLQKYSVSHSFYFSLLSDYWLSWGQITWSQMWKSGPTQMERLINLILNKIIFMEAIWSQCRPSILPDIYNQVRSSEHMSLVFPYRQLLELQPRDLWICYSSWLCRCD